MLQGFWWEKPWTLRGLTEGHMEEVTLRRDLEGGGKEKGRDGSRERAKQNEA